MNHLVPMFLLALLILANLRDPYPEYEGPAHLECYSDHLDHIAQWLPEAPVIVEAGAHYGLDTVRFVQRWPNSAIYCFEPNPYAFQQLQTNTELFSQVHRFPYALSSYNGAALLHICASTDGASSLLESSAWTREGYQGPDIQVPCMTLDTWCRSQALDHIDFLWIDLEGMELQVLKASPAILKTVRVIFTETNFRTFRKQMTLYYALKSFLEKEGFQMIAHWYFPHIQGNAIFVRQKAVCL